MKEKKDKSFFDYFKFDNVIEDIGILIKNSDKVWDILFSDNEETVKCKQEELKKEGLDFSGIKKVFNFDMDKLNTKELKIYGNTHSNIIYVNGILTDLNDLREHMNCLGKAFNSDIKAFHNETGGVLIDLIESSYDRGELERTPLAEAMAKEILAKLEMSKEDLHLIGHSQGAILLNNALEIVQDECKFEDLSRLHFYTFGAGLKNCILNNNIHIEHFANEGDLIPNMGILNKDSEVEHTGDLYTRKANGHYFLENYLMPLREGKFGTDSKFYNLVNTASIQNFLTQKTESLPIDTELKYENKSKKKPA
tara:strand:- start:2190 stop:3116 length:927 start_codon:yes stop_codon:yes gene_type:complete